MYRYLFPDSFCWQCKTDELLSLVENSLELYEVRVEKMDEIQDESNKSHAASPINRLLQDCRRMSLVTHAELEVEKQYYRESSTILICINRPIRRIARFTNCYRTVSRTVQLGIFGTIM